MLFEGLVRGNPVTLQPEPGVAESWSLSPDGLTYTFALRREARWSNGDAITSADFLYGWQRALTPALGSQYTFLFDAVKGARAFGAGETADFSTVGFAAPDPFKVEITLAQSTPYFLANVANNPIWSPVHRSTIESAGSMTDRSSGWTRPETFVGNGPFTLTDWRPNELIRLERNDHYWDAERIELNALVYYPFDSGDTQERAFRAGQLHRAILVPTAKLPAYREMADTPLVEVDALISQFLNINTSRPPFDDVRVRRAFGLALDRSALAEHVYRQTASPAYRVVPTGMPGYPTAGDIVESADDARALLAEAGFPGGAGFPQVELSTESGGTSTLPEALQARWLEVLGVRVDLLVSETRVHWNNLNQRDYTLAIGGWVADYPDATSYLDLWQKDSGWNFTEWTNAAYDSALARAAAERDPVVRGERLREAEGILMEHMPIIPLSFRKDITLQHASMTNFSSNAMDRPDYSTVRLVPAND